ncbi:MAG: prephenate dehydrogenase/arogenate dehydrogenase family protein [Firmicutes bacterium]|nr:prephenate dehydrogenase/arogenate dehydrogenase family protein [Bacillota bacterium]
MKVGIIGVGLIGGSLARALRQRGVELFLDDADASTRDQLRAMSLGTVEAWPQWIHKMDAVVLSIPILEVPAIIHQIVPKMASTAWLVDVSSMKRPVQEALLWAGERVQVMPVHLMAGRELAGLGASDADLFKGCVFAVIDVGMGVPDLETVGWWRDQLDTLPVGFWTIDEHDAAIAWVSQLPFIVSRALRMVIDREFPEARRLAGPGFRDTTRVGLSSLEALWPFIEANRAELAQAVEAIEEELSHWRAVLRNPQPPRQAPVAQRATRKLGHRK